MTVVMFALATVHFAVLNEFMLHDFIEDWVPDSSSRSGSLSRVLSVAMANLNVCSQLMVSTVC